MGTSIAWLIAAFVISLVALLIAALYSFAARGTGHWAVSLFIGFFIASLVLTCVPTWISAVGTDTAYVAAEGVPLILYNAVGTIFFDGRLQETVEGPLLGNIQTLAPADLGFLHAYVVLLLICYIATPVLAATSVYEFISHGLRDHVNRSVLGRFLSWNPRSPLYVFSGLDRHTLAFIEDLEREDGRGRGARRGVRLRKPWLCVIAGVSREVQDNYSEDLKDLLNNRVLLFDTKLETLFGQVGLFKPEDYDGLPRLRRWRVRPRLVRDRQADDGPRRLICRRLRNREQLYVFFVAEGKENEKRNLGDAVAFTERLVANVPACGDLGKAVDEELERYRRESAPPGEDDGEGRDVGSPGARRWAPWKARRERPGDSGRFIGGFPRYHVLCACHGESDEIALDSVEGTDGIDIKIIDECRDIVYQLLWEHPLYEALATGRRGSPGAPSRAAADGSPGDGPTGPAELLAGEVRRLAERRGGDPGAGNAAAGALANLNVIIVGCGNYGIEALRAVTWMGQIPSVELHLYVIDQQPPEEFLGTLEHRCPGFFEADRFGSIPIVERSAGAASAGAGGRRPVSERVVRVPEFFTIHYFSADARRQTFDDAVLAIRDEILEGDSEGLGFHTSSEVPYCIVTLGDDDLNTDTAIRLRRLFIGNGTEPVVKPMVYVDVYDVRRHRVVESMNARNGEPDFDYALRPFGGMEEVYNRRHLVQPDIEALALNVNASYSGLLSRDRAPWAGASGEAAREAGALRCATRALNYVWYASWQMNKLSNLTNARFLKTRAWLLGYGVEAGGDGPAADARAVEADLERRGYFPPAGAACPPDDEVSPFMVLARNEHDRWECFYRSEGWTGMTPQVSNTFRLEGLNAGRHDNHLFQRHPYLCSFDRLREVAASLIEKSWKPGGGGAPTYGLGDPTLNDKVLVRDTVDIIANTYDLAWGDFSLRALGPGE